VANASTGLFGVRITALRDSESQERVALYLSGRLRGKTVEEIRGYLDRLPIVVTRRAAPDLAERIQRELSNLGAVVELEPIGAETAAPPLVPPAIAAAMPGPAAGDPALPAAPAGIPWDWRRQLGFGKAFWETLKLSLLQPNDFYARMPVRGGYFEPLLYAVITTLVGLLGGFLLQIPLTLLQAGMAGAAMSNLVAGLSLAVMLFVALIAVILSPIFIVIGEFIGAIIAHFFVWLLGGRAGFEATFRVLCFANSSQVFQVVPGLGAVIGTVWWCVLVYFGYRHAHRLEKVPAFLAMILPVLLFIILIVGFIVAVIFFILGSVGSGNLDKLIPD
jgi:hypothetical protein